MADKSFGVKDINLIGASGTPTIESPNNLNINAVNVAISTDITVAGKVSLGAGTSISSPGTNVLTLGTNSVERVRIDSSGQSTFDKGAPGSANQVIARFQAESSRQLDVVWHDTGSLMGFDTPSNHAYIFKTNGAEKLRITTAGEVLKPGQPMAMCFAVTAGSKSVSLNSSTTLIPVNASSVYDPNSDLDLSTGAYTVPVSGRYLVFYGTEGKTATNNNAGSIYYNLNSGGLAGQCLYYGAAYSGASKQVILNLSANDSLVWQIYGNNGQNYAINNAAFGIYLIG